jgi:gamma-glutamylcyclotransferase (GGCT)/AIG2-like uncharacterized protein YtfP
MENSIDTRLAVYGTLAPGRSNHDKLEALTGTWLSGYVVGRLLQKGWAVDQGYPALVLDPGGSTIDVQIFVSAELPEHWNRLDDFEGSHYRRVETVVQTENGPVSAWIYETAEAE